MPKDAQECAAEIASLSLIMSFASNNFNQGLRSYYFAMAAMSWFLHPWVMIATTMWIAWVLYAREFRSRTLSVLRGEAVAIVSARQSLDKWR